MKKSYLLLFGICLACFSYSQSTENKVLKILKDGDLRVNGTSQSKIIGNVSVGMSVIQLDLNGEWYKVKATIHSNGGRPSEEVGWIHKSLVVLKKRTLTIQNVQEIVGDGLTVLSLSLALSPMTRFFSSQSEVQEANLIESGLLKKYCMVDVAQTSESGFTIPGEIKSSEHHINISFTISKGFDPILSLFESNGAFPAMQFISGGYSFDLVDKKFEVKVNDNTEFVNEGSKWRYVNKKWQKQVNK